MKKAGIVITVVGSLLLAVWLFAVLFFLFGFFMFFVIDEVEYFIDYVMLDGYYVWVNLLFLFDYLLLFVGLPGLPVLITGVILTIVGASKGKKKNAKKAVSEPKPE